MFTILNPINMSYFMSNSDYYDKYCYLILQYSIGKQSDLWMVTPYAS